MTDDELLTQIEEIRVKNNHLHVGLYRLAFEVAPDRARAIVADIIELDRQIGELDQQLVSRGN